MLQADLDAKNATGSTNSSAYYAAFWAGSKDFTIRLFKDASLSLACLIYTAWGNAGSPQGIDNHQDPGETLQSSYPNPFSSFTTIPVEIKYPGTPVDLSIYDVTGSRRATLLDKVLDPGVYNVKWNAEGFPGGIYLSVLRSGDRISSRKLVLIP